MHARQAPATNARAREINGEFVILAGSTARKQGVPSWEFYRTLRDNLVAQSKLAESDNPDYYAFKEDVVVSSPSAGASVITARDASGRTTWKVEETGQTYQQWMDQKLKGVELAEAISDE